MGVSFQSGMIGSALSAMTRSAFSESLRKGCDICKQRVVRVLVYRQTNGLIGTVFPYRGLYLLDDYMHSMNMSKKRSHISIVLSEEDEDSGSISDSAMFWMTTGGAGPLWIHPYPRRPFLEIVMDWLTEPIPDLQFIHRISEDPRHMRLEKAPPGEPSLYVTGYSRNTENGYIPVHYGELGGVNRLELLFEPRRVVGAIPLKDIGRWLKTLSIHCGGRSCLHDDTRLEQEVAPYGADYTAMVTSFMGWTDLNMSEFAFIMVLWQRAYLRYMRNLTRTSSPLILSMLDAFGEGFYEELEHRLREHLKRKHGTDDYPTAFGNELGWNRRRREIMAEWSSCGMRGIRKCK